MQPNSNPITSHDTTRIRTRLIGLLAVMGWIVLCLPSVKNKIAHLKNSLFSIAPQLRFILACLIAGTMIILSAGPAAAVQKVQDLGTNNTKTSGTTLTVTLSSAVTNGNSVIISFAADDGGGAVTCSDDATPTPNTYNVDVDETNTGNVRSLICSAHNVSGLTSGKIITVTTTNSISARAMSVTEFSSLVTSATLDQTQKNNGTGTTPTSTATSTTTVANELLIGAIGIEDKNDTLAPGTGWTGLPKDSTGTGAPDSNITIAPEYQIVTSTGAYTADGTIGSNDWAAAIATYKRLDYYLDQVAYRWRNDDGNEATATYTWGENDKIYGIPKGSGVQRLRFLVANEGTQGTAAIGYQLQVAETGTCSSGTYSAVPTDTSGDWQIIASQLADGVATDSATTGLTDPGGYTWVDGEQEDSTNTTDTITIAASYFTEIEFSVQATTNATDSGDYCFRLIDAGGVGLDNYTAYAEAMIIPATAITLASFNARGENNSVRVDWETAQEINSMGVNL